MRSSPFYHSAVEQHVLLLLAFFGGTNNQRGRSMPLLITLRCRCRSCSADKLGVELAEGARREDIKALRPTAFRPKFHKKGALPCPGLDEDPRDVFPSSEHVMQILPDQQRHLEEFGFSLAGLQILAEED